MPCGVAEVFKPAFFHPRNGTAVFFFLSLLCLFSGCRSTSLVTVENDGRNEVYVPLRKPDAVLNTFARTVDAQLTAKVITNNLTNENVIKYVTGVANFASPYDNLTIQTMMLAKAAVLGLNANPSGVITQTRFWDTLGALATNSLTIRDHLYSGYVNIEELTSLPKIVSGEVEFWTPSRYTASTAVAAGNTNLANWEKDLGKLIKVDDKFIEEKIVNFALMLKVQFPSEIKASRCAANLGFGTSGFKEGYWWSLRVEELELRRFVDEYWKFWKPSRSIYIQVRQLKTGRLEPMQ